MNKNKKRYTLIDEKQTIERKKTNNPDIYYRCMTLLKLLQLFLAPWWPPMNTLQ